MKSSSLKKIAEERIGLLFSEAEKAFSENPSLSNRYVFIARKIAMRANVKMPSSLKKKFCHKCYSFLVPGKNCIVRTNPKTKCVEYLCKSCGKKTRYGYSREKNDKK